MKRLLLISMLACSGSLFPQQTIAYTQYLFNIAGMNPAASGTDINRKYYYGFGAGRQMAGFDNAPRTHFANFSYTIRPPRSYSFWQNASVYLEQEDLGLLGNSSGYLGYTIHLLARRKLVTSFGLYAGARRFERATGLFDPNDPAVQRSTGSIFVYPDIIPGFRLTGGKFFFDVSARNLTINSMKDFKGRRIGSPSIIFPTVFSAYGRKIPLTEQLLAVPSLAMHLPLPGVPVVDGQLMFYYANRVGVGASLRNFTYASGILQIRFLESLTAGFAYSYPFNATRFVSPKNFEIMIGVVPYGMDLKSSGRHSVARCPTLNY